VQAELKRLGAVPVEELTSTYRRSWGAGELIAWLTLLSFMLAYALFFGWLSLREYWAYQMHALDMGNMGQAAWNTVHGHPFQFTNMRLSYHGIEAWDTTTRLSFHVEFAFPLIALTYVIYPHPESLLILQTLALALGALPVFLVAQDALGDVRAGLSFAGAYLLFPTLEGMNLYEFHPVALATPLLLAAFLFAWRRRYALFVLCCLASMGMKEEIGLIVAFFGLYVALINGNRRIGFATSFFGLAWSLFAVFVIEKHYLRPGTLTYAHSRFGYLGHGVGGAFSSLRHHPGVIAGVVFSWSKLDYLAHLLAPIGLLPFFAPQALILGAPSFALNLLSTDFHMSSGLGDNSAELISIVFLAGIVGARSVSSLLRRWFPQRTISLCIAVYVGLAALLTQHFYGFTPLGDRYFLPAIGSHQRLGDHFVSLIPSNVPVSTQDQLDPHLSSRRYLYLFLDTGRLAPSLPPANYILLDVSAPTYPLPSSQLHESAMSYLRSPDWGIAAADDGFILIQKGMPQRRLPARFYRFALAGSHQPSRPLAASQGFLRLVGYDRVSTDLSNHRVPNLSFTFYARVTRSLRSNLQPIVFEVMGDKMIGCVHDPLGLEWLPTSRWQQGKTYLVHMDSLETSWQSFGVARFYVELKPTAETHADCASLWPEHGRIWSIGSMSINP
jgi:uncharacterized membrane protein